MKDPKVLKEVLAQIKENWDKAPYLSEWKHVKTGDTYVVRLHYIHEATMEAHVLYYRRFALPHETWGRPAAQFFDGRFERITKGFSHEHPKP